MERHEQRLSERIDRRRLATTLVAGLVVFGGGTIPEADIKILKQQGVAELFTPGASLRKIGTWLEEVLDAREGD